MYLYCRCSTICCIVLCEGGCSYYCGICNVDGTSITVTFSVYCSVTVEGSVVLYFRVPESSLIAPPSLVAVLLVKVLFSIVEAS